MELENIIYPGFNKTLSELNALSKVKKKSCEIVDLTEIEWVRDVLRHRVEEIGSYDIKFRKPTEEEIDKYLPYLKTHIEIINPKILILLGSTALNALIGDEVVISKARGKWIQKKIGEIDTWVIASFHPAFLMRQPQQKKLAWIDLKMIREKSKALKI